MKKKYTIEIEEVKECVKCPLAKIEIFDNGRSQKSSCRLDNKGIQFHISLVKDYGEMRKDCPLLDTYEFKED